MTTERLTRMDDERLGAAVAGLDLAWPSTAAPSAQDVLDAVAVAERQSTPLLSRSRKRRLIVLLVAVVLALAATAVAARLVLDLRGLIIEQVPGPPVDLPSTPLQGPDLGRPLGLDEAAEAAGIAAAIPAALGPPDRVWLVDASAVLPEGDGALLAMAWEPTVDLPPIVGSPWGAVVFRFTGSSDLATKMLHEDSTEIRETEVGPYPAVWVTGEHELILATTEGPIRALVTGRVLVWDDLETGWRLETSLPLRDAISIAESIPAANG
ncbi:MAG: hypothetical protein ACXWW5_02470 [Actinomycetota bacterium]